MYKVMFDMYFEGRVAKDKDRYVYPRTYTELRGAQRMLREAFNVNASHRETPSTPLEGYKVVRSYYRTDAARFYIVEEDS